MGHWLRDSLEGWDGTRITVVAAVVGAIFTGWDLVKVGQGDDPAIRAANSILVRRLPVGSLFRSAPLSQSSILTHCRPARPPPVLGALVNSVAFPPSPLKSDSHCQTCQLFGPNE